MKRFLILVSTLTVLSVILAACGGGQEPATQPPAGEPGATEAPAVVPIDLAGPPMKVGSFYTYVDGSVLAAVPGGPFTMGYNFFDNLEREVSVGDFWVYTNEVTNAQYALCVNLGLCTPPDEKDNPGFGNYRFVSYPVVGVTHQQAVDYCTFVNGRLPTEAEWEKAARGPEGNLFPWGDNSPECSLLNFNYCKGKAIDVKSYPDGVSYYGLFDMAGNIREWTSDWYDVDFNKDGSIADPLGPELGQKRAVRSSSFADSTDFAIAAHRFSLKPVDHLPDLGFRCVVEDPTFYAPYCQTSILYGSDGNGNPTDDVIPLPDDCVQAGFQKTNDCKTNTINNIKVVPWPLPAGATLNDHPNCSGGPPNYVCTDSGSMTIDPQVCNVPPPPGGGQCSPGYNPQPDPSDPNRTLCIGQGPGNNCLRGFTYNAGLFCCAADIPGQQTNGFCNPGFYEIGGQCIPSQNNQPQPQQATVSWSPIKPCPDTTTGGDDSPTNPYPP